MTQGGSTKKKEFPLLYLLLFSALLAPIYGGYILLDSNSSGPGLGGLINSLMSSGMDVPILTHFLLALPVVLCIVVVLVSRRIQQTPNTVFSVCWMAFFGLLGMTAMGSSYRVMSLTLWLEWLVYGCALFITVAITGRRQGPILVLTALGVGCSILAVKGILEYASERPGNPSWRIFAGWINPNATAAMLLIGFFVCLGLCVSRNRLEAFAAGSAVVLVGFALVLTGSKGAFSLALPLGTLALGFTMIRGNLSVRLTAFAAAVVVGGICGALFIKNIGIAGAALAALYAIAACFLFGNPPTKTASGLRLLACFGILFGLTVLFSVAPQKPGSSSNSPASSTPMSRIVQGGAETQEQSTVFRKNLWKSAVNLSLSSPFTGYGLGSYRYESARPGLITATVFAHQVYLQLWAESGILTLIAFLSGIAVWFWQVLRNVSKVPLENLGPLAAVISSVVAVLSHSLVDSDLYYFGIGVAFFMLLGLGLLLSPDAVAPEFVPKGARYAGIIGVVSLALLLFVAADMDDVKAMARFDLSQRDATSFRDDVNSMSWFAAFDGDAQYLTAGSKQQADRVATLKTAYALSPTNKIGRALATAQAEDGDIGDASATYKMTLQRDPNSLLALKDLIKLQLQEGQTTEAIATAQRLVQVEDTPYFKVRSIPESIPTETYQARFQVLAPAAKTDRERADLLAAGVKGMLAYARTTAAIVFQNAKDAKDPDLREPGYDSLNEAIVKLQEAAKAAKDAEAIYRREGDTVAAGEMETDEAELLKAVADFGGSK